MAAVPSILEPPSASDSLHSTTAASRSRFRFPFRWRKSSSASQQPYSRAGDEQGLQILPANHRSVRDDLSSGSHTEHAQNALPARFHISQPLRSRKQEKVVTDPPPFAQMHGQALLCATLEAPVSYWEKSRSLKPSSSCGDVPSRDVMEDTIEVKHSHKKTNSGQSCCSTRGKIFFLVNGPYILQYDGDSEGDALPEKILVLDKDSVGGVCDSVPGRPWVLQISRTSIGNVRNQAQTLRPSWSRLTLRQPEDKRTANTLLLIFNDSEDLYTWLHAIRKEIEHLGGMEYDQETEEDDQSWRDNLTKKFASGANSESDSNKTSTSRTLSPIASPLTLNVSAHPTMSSKSRPRSKESATSSKKTSTSLDRLRDSVTSHSYSSTLATSSGCGSAPSTSPICERFPSIKSVTDHLANDLYLRSYSPNKGLQQHRASSSAPGRSILERRKLSVDSLHLMQSDELRARKTPLDLPSPISASPNDLPSQVARPLPESNIKTNPASMGHMTSATTPKVFSKGHLHQSGNDNEDLSRKSSMAGSASGLPKAKYSLFPARSAPESKPETPKMSEQPMLPDLSSSKLNTAAPKAVEKVRSAPKHRKNRSRTVTLELRQHRISTLLGAGEYHLPQRSPAVTDDMIMSNFGIARNEAPASPMPSTKVPRLGDLHIDLDFLKSPYRVPPDQSSTSGARQGPSARSNSISHGTKAPVGPPPAAPLPAVPLRRQSSCRTQRSSQHSQYCQHNLAKHGTRTEVDTSQFRSPQKDTATYVEPPSYDSAMREPRQRHRRIISSSLGGPPPPARLSSRPPSETKKSSSRSRSRGRLRPGKPQS